MPKSIRTWFFLLFLILALAVGLVLLITFSRLGGLRRAAFESRTTTAARSGAAAIHLFMAQALHTEEDISRSLGPPTLAPAERQTYLQHLLYHHPEFQDVYFLGADSVLHAGASAETSSAIRSHPAVKAVLQGHPWSLAYTPQDGPGTAPELALMAASDSGGHQGVVLGVFSLPAMAAALSQVAPGKMQIYIIDRGLRVVCGDKIPLPDDAASLTGEPGTAQALAGHEALIQSLHPGDREGEWTASFVPVQYFGWASVALSDSGEWLAPLHEDERLAAELYVLLLIGCLALGHWYSGLLLLSVRRLQRAAQAMAAGDIGYRVKIATETEMDTVGRAFNDMADRLETHEGLLHARNRQLNVLLELLEGLRTERDPAELLRRVTQDAAQLTAASVAFLALVVNDDLRLTEWWNGQRWINVELRWKIGQGVAGWVWLKHDTRSSEDFLTDPYMTTDLITAFNLKNYVCSPIVLPNTTAAGVLFVGNKAHGLPFKDDDVRIMEILARHAGVALEVEAAFLRERRIGATLQKAMLPDVDPHLGGLSIAREYQAATDEAELGGDFYDVIELGPDRIGLVIADVSGKGLRAAVQTAAVKYALRAYALEDPEPASVLSRLNKSCNAGPRTRGFITLFYGVVDLRSWEMCYANAGHQPPLLRRANGKVETLSARGVVLGIVDSSLVSFPEQTVELRGGDTLVLYTDGLSEARNGDDFLDIEGVQALLGGMNVSAHETATMLLQEATAFAEGTLRDDVALLVVKVPDPLPGQNPGTSYS